MTPYANADALTQVPLDKLHSPADVLISIKGIYTAQQEVRRLFKDTPADQAVATPLLKDAGLDVSSREQLENRWNVVWTNGEAVGQSARRILVQWYISYACIYLTLASHT